MTSDKEPRNAGPASASGGGRSPGAVASLTARPRLRWNMLGCGRQGLETRTDWPATVTADWAWGGSTGAGIRVCIIDSGVDSGHPLAGPVQGSFAVVRDSGGEPDIAEIPPGDSCGHGTACASIIRSIAPDCEIYSLQVLNRFTGSGDAFVTGLRWAVSQGFDVVNLSLSTTRRQFAQALHGLADDAYFQRSMLVASAHNMPLESFPWRFASVLSVGSHAEGDSGLFFYNPAPPVEFFAHGVDVEVAWLAGEQTKCSGNSFATPHMTGYCARILSKHPDLTPFQVKTALYLLAGNVVAAHPERRA
jgi:subtilisin family serine protease